MCVKLLLTPLNHYFRSSLIYIIAVVLHVDYLSH